MICGDIGLIKTGNSRWTLLCIQIDHNKFTYRANIIKKNKIIVFFGVLKNFLEPVRHICYFFVYYFVKINRMHIFMWLREFIYVCIYIWVYIGPTKTFTHNNYKLNFVYKKCKNFLTYYNNLLMRNSMVILTSLIFGSSKQKYAYVPTHFELHWEKFDLQHTVISHSLDFLKMHLRELARKIKMISRRYWYWIHVMKTLF